MRKDEEMKLEENGKITEEGHYIINVISFELARIMGESLIDKTKEMPVSSAFTATIICTTGSILLSSAFNSLYELSDGKFSIDNYLNNINDLIKKKVELLSKKTIQ